MDLKQYVARIENFPKDGVDFLDVSPLLGTPVAWRHALDILAREVAKLEPTSLAAMDARGFVIAGALADRLGIPFFMIRKKGKLPGATYGVDYDLEYGSASIEMQKRAVEQGDRVIIIDDVLATGGTAKAASDLIKKAGGDAICLLCLIELAFLNGRDNLAGLPVKSLLAYDAV